jgi:hypothetical protein
MQLTDLSLHLAGPDGLRWAQCAVTEHHYLHHPVDMRCRPLSYLIQSQGVPLGCLIFGRPEATRVNGWYGDVWDVQGGKCPLSRWQVLNLARVWIDPRLQHDGVDYVPNVASWAIAQALRRVGYEFLIKRPPVWLEEPYEIREVLSYCQSSTHRGTLYRAANFTLKRTNERGIETWVRPLRRLTHAEHYEIALRSREDQRGRRLRAARLVTQLALFEQNEYEVVREVRV